MWLPERRQFGVLYGIVKGCWQRVQCVGLTGSTASTASSGATARVWP